MALRTLFAPFRSLSKGGTPLFFYNTLRKEKQLFEPVAHAKEVRMYNCGPTVYDTSHIGNLRSYVFADIVRRTLEYNGLRVKQVINITDFGHLSSDADAGDDKMSAALKRAGLELTLENMHELAEKYTAQFLEDLQRLNIDTSRIEFPRASSYISGEIALIQTLEEKGYTYRGASGVYFDTTRFPDYGKLGDIRLAGLKEGARVAPAEDKRTATDFLLWKSDSSIGWESPWGLGFPGWHIECSAMIRATLGTQIDIHTGGIDLMPTHHNNEIAQSESATGKRPLARFWLHHEFLNLTGAKISKSAGNMINLSELISRGYDPLSYRYFLLGAHYRTPVNFTWDALQAAQNAYQNLLQRAKDLEQTESGAVPPKYEKRFRERINDDLDTAGTLAILWEMIKDPELSREDITAGLLDFDRVLGLALGTSVRRNINITLREAIAMSDLPADIRTLIREREEARTNKDWSRADELRKALADKGYSLEDSASGARIFKQ